jgi:hypothetical protein
MFMRLVRWSALVAVLGVLFAMPARAQSVMLDGTRQPQGTLGAVQTGTGASASSVCMGIPYRLNGAAVCGRGYYWAVAFTFTNTAGTATAEIDVNCDGAGWVPVANSSKSLTTNSDGVSVTLPQCAYRANVTACSSCSVTTSYDAGRQIP